RQRVGSGQVGPPVHRAVPDPRGRRGGVQREGARHQRPGGVRRRRHRDGEDPQREDRCDEGRETSCDRHRKFSLSCERLTQEKVRRQTFTFCVQSRRRPVTPVTSRALTDGAARCVATSEILHRTASPRASATSLQEKAHDAGPGRLGVGMCGLLGVFGPAADAPEAVWSALPLLRHRGPDETLTACGDGYALGFQRLAVVDIEGNRQPLSYPPSGPDADRLVLAFNGEIYNHHELRELLTAEYG